MTSKDFDNVEMLVRFVPKELQDDARQEMVCYVLGAGVSCSIASMRRARDRFTYQVHAWRRLKPLTLPRAGREQQPDTRIKLEESLALLYKKTAGLGNKNLTILLKAINVVLLGAVPKLPPLLLEALRDNVPNEECCSKLTAEPCTLGEFQRLLKKRIVR